MTLPDAALGAVIAALIAGVLSLVQLIIAKENETSRFRQAWIDELRNEVAGVVASVNNIHILSIEQVKVGESGTPSRDLIPATQHAYYKFNKLEARIRLRLNVREPQSRQILTRLSELDTLLKKDLGRDFDELKKIGDELVTVTQPVLKAEWERVKTGELPYVSIKYFSLFLVVTLILVAAFHIVTSYHTGKSVIQHEECK